MVIGDTSGLSDVIRVQMGAVYEGWLVQGGASPPILKQGA